MFLFKIYGLKPDFVILGKGFSGGEYPSAKIVTTYEMDSMSQFGALVTNGQQELSSLAYLITMKFFADNAKEIGELGAYIEKLLEGVQQRHSSLIKKIEGKGHLLALHFDSLEDAGKFAKTVNAMCIDVSAQTYKPNCPPAALLKLPVIMSEELLETMVNKFEAVIKQMEA
jgi:acetylornithine/succinyldiaminopimelate/putrescine aminotransferase